MDDTNPTTERTIQTHVIKDRIDQIIPLYLDIKDQFFTSAAKREDIEYHETISQAYGDLIHTLHLLLDAITPDSPNTQATNEILQTQEHIEELDRQTEITEDTIKTLRTLTTWAEMNPLNPYLRTLKPILYI
jgi:hypothetical protein